MSSQNVNFVRRSSNSIGYGSHNSSLPLLNLYLVIYNNEKLKITPKQMRQIFTKQKYKYSTVRMHLHKWNYRVEFGFETRDQRNDAIQEIRKIKEKYDVGCYFYFQRGCATYSLMEEWEYRNAINFGNQNPSIIASKLPQVPTFAKPKVQVQVQKLPQPSIDINEKPIHTPIQKRNSQFQAQKKDQHKQQLNKKQKEISQNIKQQKSLEDLKFSKKKSQRQSKNEKILQIQKSDIIKSVKQKQKLSINQLNDKKVHKKIQVKEKRMKDMRNVQEDQKNSYEMVDQEDQQNIKLQKQGKHQKFVEKVSKQILCQKDEKVLNCEKQIEINIDKNHVNMAQQQMQDSKQRGIQDILQKNVQKQTLPFQIELNTRRLQIFHNPEHLKQRIEEQPTQQNKSMEIQKILKDIEMVDRLLQLQIMVINYIF